MPEPTLRDHIDRIEAERAVKREELRAALRKTLSKSDLSEFEKSTVLYSMAMQLGNQWAKRNSFPRRAV